MESYSKEASISNGVVYIFTSPACGQCKMIKPRLEKEASAHPEYKFLEVNTATDEGLELARKYKVSMLPTAVIPGEFPVVLTGAGQVNMKNIVKAYDSITK